MKCKDCEWFYRDYDCGHTNPESDICGDFENRPEYLKPPTKEWLGLEPHERSMG